MTAALPSLSCANAQCQQPQTIAAVQCEQCKTPLVWRYLWVIGESGPPPSLTEGLWGDRYWGVGPQMVLDTQPARVPPAEEIPDWLQPYLRLAPLRPAMPQVYGSLCLEPDGDIYWLLDYGSVPRTPENLPHHGELLPQLTETWSQTMGLRQLSWLRQIAHLWNPFTAQGVSATLTQPALLLVNGPVVQVRSLQSGQGRLRDLGQLWARWQASINPPLQDWFERLCQYLRQGEIADAQHLIAILDEAIAQWDQRHCQRTYHLYTLSDSGPQRDHNEDACFPPSGNEHESLEGEELFALVCDGIGGHAGGEVASGLAIETLVPLLTQLKEERELSPEERRDRLTAAINQANDRICDRNDEEQRQERQRMGTTLVLALTRGPEVYLSHVGDSRIYEISHRGCYPLTWDDDLASREVRLGYAIHRQASQYAHGGSLVQALGMAPSSMLHPNHQRWCIDESAAILLCSDGLSDLERLEQFWMPIILPLLQEKDSLRSVGQKLIGIANSFNGHDNSTIALLYCHVRAQFNPGASLPLPDLQVPYLPSPPLAPTLAPGLRTTFPPSRPQGSAQRAPLPPWLISLGVGLGALATVAILALAWRFLSPSSSPPVPPPVPIPPPAPPAATDLVEGQYRRFPQAIALKQDPNSNLKNRDLPVLAAGSVVKITGKTADRQWWVVQPCSASSPQPQGWLTEAVLSQASEAYQPPASAKLICSPPTPKPNQ